MCAQDNGGEGVMMRGYVVYRDHPTLGPPTPLATNHMGRPYKSYDEAGMVVIGGYDFKGQPKEKIRRVIKDSLIIGAMPTIYRVEWDGLDELHTFIGSKRNECYVSYALCRETKQVIDFVTGSRTKLNLERLTGKLIELAPIRVYTDGL